VVAGNYDMTHFHRIIDNFMIQGGDFENHDGTGGYAADWYGYCNGQSASQGDCAYTSWTIPDEADNGLLHIPCTISMAKTSAPDTGGSQFFIIPEDSTPSHLNGVHTVFGEVTEGCEHITTISEVATGDNDRPILPVVIYSATLDN
jgi:cyclophilin family peptidyl-prolyl cis-trans isomerase